MVVIGSSFSTIAHHLRQLLLCVCLCWAAFAPLCIAAKPSDVRLVIDISGSMKKNDPENLRRPALDLLVKLLPEGSKAGVWTFGQYVNMLVPHRVVDEQWRKHASRESQAINSIAQFTNIGTALEKSAYDSGYSSNGEFNTHVILLTDGMVDIDRDPGVNQKEWRRIVDSVLPTYQRAGYTLHTIALSDNADKDLMDKLALGTDGTSAIARSADDLMNIFLGVFDQAVPAEQLPFDGNSFVTDSSIEEFTALIFRKPGSPPSRLVGPGRTEYTRNSTDGNVAWHSTEKYDLITVKRPFEGEWQVHAELEPESRITVVSDLSLVVKPLPNNIKIGEKVDLSLVLQEEGKTITRAEFLDLLDIDYQLVHTDTSAQWQQRLSDGLVPGNGIYQHSIDHFKKSGQYEVTVKVDGKSFQRQFVHRATVREPFGVELNTETVNGATQYIVTVNAYSQDINFAKTEVVGKLKDPSGSSNIKRFTLTENDNWRLVIKPALEGEYQLALRITALNKQGNSFDVIPETLRFSYPENDKAFKDPFAAENADAAALPTDMSEATNDDPGQVDSSFINPDEPIVEDDISEDVDDEPSSNTLLYSILGVANLLIIAIAFVLYKMFMGKNKDGEDQDGGDAEPKASKKKASKKKAKPAPEPEPEPEAAPELEEPPMDDMNIEDDDGFDDSFIEEPVEDLAEEPADVLEETVPDEIVTESLDSDIDLSDTDVGEEELAIAINANPDDLPKMADDEPSSDDNAMDISSLDDDVDLASDLLADEEDEEPEFSLDDFAPDSLDDEDEDK